MGTNFPNGLESRGVPVFGGFSGGGGLAMPQKIYFVDGNNGNDGNTGLKQDSAFKTIQQAVDIANVTENITTDVDIYVMTGVYTEQVRIIKSHMTTTELLWTAGGINTGYVGKLRIVAVGCAFLNGGSGATKPTIEIERPNVEVHNFEMIYLNTSETISAGNWTTSLGDDCNEGGGAGMPAIYMGDNYNVPDGTIDYAASNKILIKNCRVNGGVTGGNAILIDGSKHAYIIDCIVEYGQESGIRMKGTAKGSGAENVISGCIFNQNAADIYSQAQITCVIKNCLFMNENATDHLVGSSGNSLNWIDNCSGLSEDAFENTGASGWDATRICTSTNGGPSGSTNLTTDTWKSGASIS